MAQKNKQTETLDDYPAASRVGNRQLFLNQYYGPLAMIPFMVTLFVTLKFFGNTRSIVATIPVFASLAWAIGVAGYAFYLNFWFKCPRCGSRFGLGDQCPSCDLPRHAGSDGMFESLTN